VRLYRPDSADRAGKPALLGGGDLYPELLNLGGVDLDRAGDLRFFALVNRDVIHPHAVFFRYGRGIWQTHRVAVVEDLAFAGRGLGGGRRGWPAVSLAFVNRDVFHPHLVLFREGRVVGLSHRILVIEDLALTAVLRRRVVCPAGDQLADFWPA